MIKCCVFHYKNLIECLAYLRRDETFRECRCRHVPVIHHAFFSDWLTGELISGRSPHLFSRIKTHKNSYIIYIYGSAYTTNMQARPDYKQRWGDVDGKTQRNRMSLAEDKHRPKDGEERGGLSSSKS